MHIFALPVLHSVARDSDAHAAIKKIKNVTLICCTIFSIHQTFASDASDGGGNYHHVWSLEEIVWFVALIFGRLWLGFVV
jgi:hypothetical protein